MGRKSDAKERLLATGAELLGQRPYSSVGVAEICSAAGVPKGSFYYFFPSKQDFALAVINAHWQAQHADWKRVLGSERSVTERLHELFVATAALQQRALTDAGVVAGCMFGNLALELGSMEPLVQTRLREIFETQVEMVTAALGADEQFAGLDGDGLNHLATAVVAQLEGLVLFAKLFSDPSQVERHWQAVERLLTPIPVG